MNKIEEYLSNLALFYDRGDKLIEWSDIHNFQKSWILNYNLEFIMSRQKTLKIWRANIGKEVHPPKDSFSYCLVEEYEESYFLDKLFFDASRTIIFTESLFDEFCEKYLEYQIEYLTDELLNGALVSNSTSKLLNLTFEWRVECKQELLSKLKSVLQ